DHYRVIDRFGAMHARRHARLVLHDPEYRSGRIAGGDLARRAVLVAGDLGRHGGGRPHDAARMLGPAGDHVPANLVDLDDRLAISILARDDAPDLHISTLVPSSITRLVGMLKKSVMLPALRAMAAKMRSRQNAMPLRSAPWSTEGTIFSRDMKKEVCMGSNVS